MRHSGSRRPLGLPRPYQLAGRSLEWIAATVCCASLLAVFLADVLTPADVVLSALALFPMLFAAWTFSTRLATSVTLFAGLLLVAEAVFGSSDAITVGVEIAVYAALAILTRLHARHVASVIPTRPVPTEVNPLDGLTRREREVVALAARGRTASEIGDLLHIGERTVETHLANAYPKLGIRSKVELVKLAQSFGV